MAKDKNKPRRRSYKAKKSHRAKPRDIHVIPDALATLAPVVLLTEDNPGGSSVFKEVMNGNYAGAGNNLVGQLTTWQGLRNPLVLLAGAVVVKKLGKVGGFNRIGGKHWKVF